MTSKYPLVERLRGLIHIPGPLPPPNLSESTMDAIEEAADLIEAMGEALSTEGAVVGWIRGVKGASTPWDPGEWNVDYVHGDCPPGDGWTPLYASPSPSPDEVDEWREIVRELLPYAIANPTNEGGITIRERAARMLGGQCSKCGGVPDDHIANYYCPEFVAEAPVPSRVASPDRDAIIEMCAKVAETKRSEHERLVGQSTEAWSRGYHRATTDCAYYIRSLKFAEGKP